MEVNLISTLKSFAWTLIRGRIRTKDNLRKIGMHINVDYPLCENQLEDINHLFTYCPLVREVWSTIAGDCPIPNNHIITLYIGLIVSGKMKV